jgi:hypothetical protein
VFSFHIQKISWCASRRLAPRIGARVAQRGAAR